MALRRSNTSDGDQGRIDPYTVPIEFVAGGIRPRECRPPDQLLCGAARQRYRRTEGICAASGRLAKMSWTPAVLCIHAKRFPRWVAGRYCALHGMEREGGNVH